MKYMVISLLFILFDVTIARRCGVSNLKKKSHRNVYSNQDITAQSILKQTFQPIRIHVDYSAIEHHHLKDDLKLILDKAVDVLQKLVKVRRLTNPLIVNIDKCSDYVVPDLYKSKGVKDADLILFVGLNTSGSFKEDKTEAEASFCLQESISRRPIAGYIEFSNDIELKDQTRLWDYMTWLSIHETTHVLVMDEGLYADFVNKETLDKLGLGNVVGQKQDNDHKYKYIKSPKVLEMAKKHFACEKLEGVPLESVGTDETAGCHWSKKYMNTDYMIGDSYGENLISEITLALLEDSGWYEVDYGMANVFLWGKNKGCKFFEEKCIQPIYDEKSKEQGFISNFIPEFCAKLNYSTCSRSHIFRAQCAGKKYNSPLNEYERFFNDPYIGGADDMTQKCPTASDEYLVSTDYYESSCRIGTLKLNSDLEKVCPECACFMSTLKEKKENSKGTRRRSRLVEEYKKLLFKRLNVFTGEYKPNVKLDDNTAIASCYEYKCNGSSLYVIIKGMEYVCPKNEILEIPEYSGFIICPNSEEICQDKYKCKFGCTEKFQNKDYSVSIKTMISINQVSSKVNVKIGKRLKKGGVRNSIKHKQTK